MVDKIEFGKRYRVALNECTYRPRKEAIKKYSNNNTILISEIHSIGWGYGGLKKKMEKQATVFLINTNYSH